MVSTPPGLSLKTSIFRTAMLKFLLVMFLVAIAAQNASAQKSASVTYMQIFYEGPNWLAGRRVLSYSPAFRGKTQEVVQESDSTRQLSPTAFLMGPTEPVTITKKATLTTITTEKGTFIPDQNGKMHLETPADRKQARQRETEQFNIKLNMLEKRADLGKAVLARALNEAAANGWEVVQMTAVGTAGGLVYLLRHP
jgi:hypothetical protein